MGAAKPEVVLHLVNGTFPRGLVAQWRRNLRAWRAARRGQLPDEEALVPPPASEPTRRYWFEEGSPFEKANEM